VEWKIATAVREAPRVGRTGYESIEVQFADTRIADKRRISYAPQSKDYG
jgi:hypothetical protein